MRRSESVKVSIIMPVYNERATVETVVRRVLEVPLDLELLIVDDASRDGTPEILAGISDPRVRLFRHATNRGKGAAIRTAIPHTTGDLVVIQDADLEYDPEQIPALLAPIEAGVADVVYGSRYLRQGGERRLVLHYLANRFLTTLSNLLNGLRLTDMETCYKCIQRETLQSLRLRSDRFGFEPEVTAKLARGGARFLEVPVSYRSRGYSEGKKIRLKDGIAAIGAILRYRFFD